MSLAYLIHENQLNYLSYYHNFITFAASVAKQAPNGPSVCHVMLPLSSSALAATVTHRKIHHFFGLSHIAECNHWLIPAVFVPLAACAFGGRSLLEWVGGWVHMLACASTELSVVCCLCGICHAKLSWLCKGICLCMLNLHASAAFWRDFKASERGRWPLQRILSLVELCKKYVQTLGLEYWKIGESVAQEIWMRELRTGRGL